LRYHLMENQHTELINKHVPKGALVYLLGVIGSHSFLLSLCERSAGVVLIDHQIMAAYISNMPEKPTNLTVISDAKKSSAVLAYEHFGLEATVYKSLWPAFELARDQDIWPHKLADTKAFTTGFDARQYDYKDPEELVKNILVIDLPAVIEEGRALLEKRAAELAERKQGRIQIHQEWIQMHEEDAFNCVLCGKDLAREEEVLQRMHQRCINDAEYKWT